MTMISVCVAVFFVVGYALAKKYLDPLILLLRKLTATEAVPSCVLALVLVYAVSAEWFGSVAAITGAYLIGYVFAGSEYKSDIERSFYAIGHGLLIPLFFVSIGLTSDYRALGGHWLLLSAILFVAVIGKLFGCGLAALASGMDKVRSFRVGCGMISRGEVGLIVTAMAASTGIFSEAEIAVMVAVVLLTTLVTPLALRGAFQLRSQQDFEEGLLEPDPMAVSAAEHAPFPPAAARPADTPPDDASFSMLTTSKTSLLAFGGSDNAQEIK